jgi:MYXO-CTERM domain-containing protein
VCTGAVCPGGATCEMTTGVCNPPTSGLVTEPPVGPGPGGPFIPPGDGDGDGDGTGAGGTAGDGDGDGDGPPPPTVGSESPSSQGCGCRVASPAGSWAALSGLLSLIGLLAFRRRRA